jgi:ABC-type Na+ efflux pump permease subunit
VFGLSAKGAEHRAPRNVWHNPIAWREAAARNATFGRMLARWSFIAAGGVWGLGLILYYHGGALTTPGFRAVLLYTVIGELAVITLVALNMGATSVAKEREDGTLDLLLTTPITPAQYLGGKLRGMVAYLLPLLGVPLGTLLIAGLYVMIVDLEIIERPGGVSVPYTVPGGALTFPVPGVLPEAGIVATIVTVPFIAFCVMVGVHWSLKSKGSLGAVVATVGIVGAAAGVIGLCAFAAGAQVPVAGPVLAALSPAAAIFAGVQPEDALTGTLNEQGLGNARLTLAIGAVLAAGLWIGVVYALRAGMTHNFDMTVRRLAGTA